MNDYHKVAEALAAGNEPATICATCPWTRTCIEPPQMTAGEVQRQMDEAKAKDAAEAAAAAARGDKSPMPAGMLITALAYAGRDTRGPMCPVFSLRLRTSGGRQIADAIKSQMQDWDDQS